MLRKLVWNLPLWDMLLLQIFMLFFGGAYWGKFWPPYYFLGVSIAMGIYHIYLQLSRNNNSVQIEKNKQRLHPIIYFIIGVLTIVVSFEEVRKGFIHYPMPTPNSDVMVQLETLYDRWAADIFPYTPVPQRTYQPFPVYMPMHFLPVGLGKWLSIDIRWCGYIIYALVSGILGYFIGRKNWSSGFKVMLTLLPALPLWCYILWGIDDIYITLEVLIAAYYLLLASGLLLRNNGLILLGIGLCLLSRYTFIFWLPLFGILFMINQPIKTTIIMVISIIIIVTLGYIQPFYLHDPSILSKGVAYHNGCAVGEWKDGFWTSVHGIHFAYNIKNWIKGSVEHGVYMNRVIQASMLLLTLFSGLFLYFRKRKHFDFYLFSLSFLYFFMLIFYCFSPLTYRYYLVVLLALSVALTISGLILKKNIAHSSNSHYI